jgi:plasmid maintenance system antidote protein VapI
VPLGLSSSAPASEVKCPSPRINSARGRRAVTPETALGLPRSFEASRELWMDQQTAPGLKTAAWDAGAKGESEIPRPSASACSR